MKRMRIMGLCLVALCALAAAFAGSASAKGEKPKLVFSTGGKALPAGAEIKAFSSNLIFVTADGNLECSKNTLTGKITTNEGTKENTGKIETETSKGGEEKEACKTGLGPAQIESAQLPWAIKFTTKGAAEIKANVEFISYFLALGGAECKFLSKKVKSTFPVNSKEATITTTKQKFKLVKGSNAACPKSGELSGTFALTSGGAPIETSY